MRIEDIKFGNFIQDKNNGRIYKITGGRTINNSQVVEVKQVNEEESLCLNYVLENFELKKEWELGEEIF